MKSDLYEIVKRLVGIQNDLRLELFEEIQRHADDIESVFDPYSYSPVVHELREKYLNRLYVLQAVLQELAHYNQGQARRHPPAVVMSVKASDSEQLVELVNRKLAKLNGAKVLDVKFLQNKQDDDWVALITYVANPLTSAQGEPSTMI